MRGNSTATCHIAHVPELPLNLCRIQLELVEDKLRELRLLTLDPREYDDKTVTLSQLDRVRQELLATAKGELKYVTFGKVRPRLHAVAMQRQLWHPCRLQVSLCTFMRRELMQSLIMAEGQRAHAIPTYAGCGWGN